LTGFPTRSNGMGDNSAVTEGSGIEDNRNCNCNIYQFATVLDNSLEQPNADCR